MLPVVRALAHYPVKGMAGIAAGRARISLQGLEGDRLYAFVRTDRLTPFPWLTMREFPGLVRYRPRWADGAAGRAELLIEAPNGKTLPVTGEELAALVAREAGLPVRLHADYRGNHDVAQVSLISEATVADICEAAGVPPDSRRFRMNIVVSGLEAFGEDRWVGRTLRIGGAQLAVVARDQRCAVITIDPDTAQRTPATLTVTGARNGACAGVYAVVLEAGDVAVGDEVVLDG